jgi:hypothetical protein
MFTPVNRWKRILVRVLVAAQLLAAAPFASASPAASDHADASPCAEMMGMAALAADEGDCPCCPDGTDSLRDCLVACTLAAAAICETPVFARAPEPSLRVDAPPTAPLHSLTDPPLKPPPIR